jgi:hypothetical protein
MVCFSWQSSVVGNPWYSLHPETVQEAITFSPKYTSRASLVARVAILLSVRRCGYLARTLAHSLNFSLLIAVDGKILAFFFGLTGLHLGG